MGIPLYFHTIAKTYHGILHMAKHRPCDWFFMDYNGCIHQGAAAVAAEAEDAGPPSDLEAYERRIYEHVWDYTVKCAGVAQPRHKVGLYIDGVAPVAKINQQRKRRYLSIKRHELLGTKPTWDTNAISPGTTFMIRLQAFLKARMRDASAPYTLSSADEPGEGEHKMFAHIAAIPAGETVFIHGLDADLIMLSLMSHHSNLVLMREPTWPFASSATQEGFLYMDIDCFRTGLLKHLRDEYGWPVPAAAIDEPYGDAARALIETYVVCCFLLGNDFLPHAPTLSLKKHGYDELLRAARTAFAAFPEGAVVGSRVFMPFLTDILGNLAKHEDEKLFDINRDYMMRKPSPKVDVADAYPLRDGTKDKLASAIHHSAHPKRWRSLYYKHLFAARLNDTSVVARACELYTTGICWTYAYYKRLPKPFDWYYPYGYPPTLLDLANYLNGTPPHHWEAMQAEWNERHRHAQFLDPAMQLLCILPIASSHLVPYKYRAWMTDHAHGCAYMFPESYPIQTYLHTHLWECAPVLPPIDIPWLLECAKGA
jgi:5'-3' exoribonuclease 1